MKRLFAFTLSCLYIIHIAGSAHEDIKPTFERRIPTLAALCRTAVVQQSDFATKILPALQQSNHAEKDILIAMRINNALLQRISLQSRNLKDQENFVRTVWSLAFSPDGTMLASGSDCAIRLWDVAKGTCRIFRDRSGSVFSLAFSPDGEILASGSEDCTIRLWNVLTGACRIFQDHKSTVYSVSFSPDGSILASGSGDHTVRLWNVLDGACRILKGHESWVSSVAFSPDGAMLASGSEDGAARLWNVATSLRQSVFADSSSVPEGFGGQAGACHILHQEDSIYSVAYSQDGILASSGSEDGIVRLCNVATHLRQGYDGHTGACNVLQGHRTPVLSIAFNPDGTKLVSGSEEDTTLRLWDFARGTCHTLQDEQHGVDWIRPVAFSPDGTTVASGSSNGILKLWFDYLKDMLSLAHIDEQRFLLAAAEDWLSVSALQATSDFAKASSFAEATANASTDLTSDLTTGKPHQISESNRVIFEALISRFPYLENDKLFSHNSSSTSSGSLERN